MDESEDDTFLFPAWKEGIKRFRDAGFAAGDTVEHGWFFEAFGLQMPAPDTPCREAEKTRLQFLAAFETMRQVLLEEYQVALASVRSIGYRIVPPAEQTKWAESEGIEDVKHAMRKMASRLTNVDMTAISAERRKDNADALARLSMLSGMVKQIGH